MKSILKMAVLILFAGISVPSFGEGSMVLAWSSFDQKTAPATQGLSVLDTTPGRQYDLQLQLPEIVVDNTSQYISALEGVWVAPYLEQTVGQVFHNIVHRLEAQKYSRHEFSLFSEREFEQWEENFAH